MKCSVLVLRCSVLCLVLVLGAACGSKGDPLPPRRPVPDRAKDLSITRTEGGTIALRFTIPSSNSDDTVPVDIAEVQVFALTKPVGDPAPTAADLAGGGDKTRAATINVRRPPIGGAATGVQGPASTDPEPGTVYTWEDKSETTVYPTPMVRYYVVAGVSSRNRIGALTDVVSVPLTPVPDAPTKLTVSFTERVIKLDWLGASPSAKYRIYDVKDGRAITPPLNAEPQSGTSYEDARLEFGVERCYLVRAAVVTGISSVESADAGPVCVTPRDIFPPSAPANLTAVAGSGAVSLIWDAVDASDLAGYLVLRAEAPGDKLLPLDKLEPLFAAPITETTYKDATAVAGTRYVYAVVAIDKAVPPNRSAASNRVEETGRQ